MGERKLSKAARFERMFKIWEYLKKNIDKDHPTTQAEMRESLDDFMGDKETFNRLIKDMAYIMNSDEHGYKREENWKIYFHDFKKFMVMLQKIMMRKQGLIVMKSMKDLLIGLCVLRAYITTEPFLMTRLTAS